MYVKELWRYPVKSMAGERLAGAELTPGGFRYDRAVLVVGQNGRIITSRTHYRLLGLRATVDKDGTSLVSGHRWDSAEALKLVRQAAGSGAELISYGGADRFDVLPLLIATDGAIAHLGFDGRRLRPNIVVGGVTGLEERRWPGRRLRIGDSVVRAAQLRRRCVMTTYDPDTLHQDRDVLQRIIDELGGRMALDCSVVQPGRIREGDPICALEGS